MKAKLIIASIVAVVVFGYLFCGCADIHPLITPTATKGDAIAAGVAAPIKALNKEMETNVKQKIQDVQNVAQDTVMAVDSVKHEVGKANEAAVARDQALAAEMKANRDAITTQGITGKDLIWWQVVDCFRTVLVAFIVFKLRK